MLHEVFPKGLLPVTTSGDKPLQGVILMSDSNLTRSAGLLNGDVIVGLDGWRVDNYKQFRSIAWFNETEPMVITFWRGDALHTVKVNAPYHDMDVQFRSYPVQGWSEE